MIKLTLLDGSPVFVPAAKIKVVGASPLLDGPNTIKVRESPDCVAAMMALHKTTSILR